MKKSNESLIKALEQIRDAVGIVLGYTKQQFDSELENLRGEWVRDDARDTVIRVYHDSGKHYCQNRKSNPLNSHIRVLTFEIAGEEGGLYLNNGMETAVVYDRESDTMMMDTGKIYKRKEE